MKALVFILIFFTATKVVAQESNYANYQVGANSTMMSGAITAGVKDNSAVFYNPGALAFVENTNLTLETGYLYGGLLKIANGAGEGLPIKSTFFDLIPGSVSGTIKSNKLPNWTFTYSIMTTNSSYISFNVRNSKRVDLLTSNPGDEWYLGQYAYKNKRRENGLSFGTAKKIGNRIGLGISVFGSYQTQDYQLNQEASLSEIDSSLITNTLAFSRLTRKLNFSNLSLVFQLGMVYKLEHTKWAINLTAPKLNVNLFATATVSENINVFLPSGFLPPISISRYGEKLKTTQKSPFIIALGHQSQWGNNIINFKVSYFSKINKYARVVVPKEPNRGTTAVELTNLEVFDEAAPILNMALGIYRKINDGLAFMGGARTDFNYLKKIDKLRTQDFYARMSYWNIYHLTGGVIWNANKLHLTLGGDYGFGLKSGGLQQINLTSPTLENLLFGERTTNTSTWYNQIYVVVGLSYKFD